MMSSSIRRLGVLLVLAMLVQSFVVEVRSFDVHRLTIDYDLLVVLVGMDINVSELRSSIDVDEIEASYGSYTIVFRFNVTIVEMPRNYVEKLRVWLAEHYMDLGKPWWVLEYEEERNVTLVVRWVPLIEFYNYLYQLVERYDREHGLDPEDHIVFLGDLDGVSRQYVARVRHPEGFGEIVLEGVRGWGGCKPMTFYDLTTIPRPRPEPYQPFAGLGTPTNFVTDPPIWDLKDVESYVARIVRNHLRFHVVNAFIGMDIWFARSIELQLYFVDFGNRSKVEELIHRLNVSYLIDLLHSYAPWINYVIEVRILNASELPRLAELARKNVVDGWIAFPYPAVAKVFDRYVSQVLDLEPPRGFIERWRYAVFVLVTTLPSYLTINGFFNFTGFSTPIYAVITYPGYRYRIARSSLVKGIAHEVGHALGLQHPFQALDPSGRTSIEWLMDWVASVMSYEDSSLAGFGYPPRDYYSMYRLAIVHTLAILSYVEETNSSPTLVEEVLKLMSRGKCFDALNLSLSYLESMKKPVVGIPLHLVETIAIRVPLPR